MSANNNDSDDLEDLDYGDDDFDLESKTEQSQNSNSRARTQDVSETDDEGDDEGEEEHDDEDDEDTASKRAGGQGINNEERLNLSYMRSSKKRISQNKDSTRGQKRKRRGDDGDDDDDEDQGDEQDQSQKNGDKTNVERCKFWPYCTAGDECSFYHPTKPCRTFPNCRFGSSCLYIHPPCKYLPFCTRSDCPFAHPAKQTSAMRRPGIIGGMVGRPPIPTVSQLRPQPAAVVQQPSVPKCKFGFKCSNPMCKFSHQTSEPCRYGANCLLENCAFTHPTDQHQSKKPTNVFKWTANS